MLSLSLCTAHAGELLHNTALGAVTVSSAHEKHLRLDCCQCLLSSHSLHDNKASSTSLNFIAYCVSIASLWWHTASIVLPDQHHGLTQQYGLSPALMLCTQDLANSRLLSHNAASGRRTLFASPIPVLRYEPDLASCPLDTWAPKSGPVRPLLQVSCIRQHMQFLHCSLKSKHFSLAMTACMSDGVRILCV